MSTVDSESSSNSQGERKRASIAAPSASLATTWPGMDLTSYPGDAVMQSWWNNSPFYFTGFYLAPAPDHTDTSWMTKRSTLASQGWGFGILYVGRQEGWSNLTFAQGETDAENGVSLAQSAGFPEHAILFLDIESGGTLPTNLLDYINGWATGLSLDGRYEAGVYCNSSSAAQIEAYVSPAPLTFWCVNVNCSPSPGCTVPSGDLEPSSSGYAAALIWQYAQSPEPLGVTCSGYTAGNCQKTYGGNSLNVDLDTSTSYNPSQG